MENGAVGSTAPRRGHHRAAEQPARPGSRRCLTEFRPVARARGAFNERLKRRGETRTRHEAGLPVLRNQVLRPEPQPDRLPELRHGFRGRAQRRSGPPSSGSRSRRRSRSPAAVAEIERDADVVSLEEVEEEPEADVGPDVDVEDDEAAVVPDDVEIEVEEDPAVPDPFLGRKRRKATMSPACSTSTRSRRKSASARRGRRGAAGLAFQPTAA